MEDVAFDRASKCDSIGLIGDPEASGCSLILIEPQALQQSHGGVEGDVEQLARPRAKVFAWQLVAAWWRHEHSGKAAENWNGRNGCHGRPYNLGRDFMSAKPASP
jgi:hypothetical protein